MQALTLREATGEELAGVPSLLQSAYREHRPHFPSTVWRSYRRELAAAGKPPARGAVVLAVRGSAVVGTVTFYPDAAADGHPWPPATACLRLLAVHAAARGAGVGRALVTECIARAGRAGAGFLGLHTAPFMAAANNLYAAVGFVRAPRYDFDAEAHYGVDAQPSGRLCGEAFLLRLGTSAR